ncbi:MAG: DUF411 domain-containing protein [Jannaschia sp.]
MPDRRHVLSLLAAAASFNVGATRAWAAGSVAMHVHKSPGCGCCEGWADLARSAGYDVTVTEMADVDATKDGLGVPDALWSCHTVEVGGYVLEGHVPFEAVAALLADRPDVAGLAVPGMPMGSPGMGNDPAARFDVLAWGGAAGDGSIYYRAGTADPLAD